MAGTARPIYSSSGVIKQFAGLGGTNADELLIDKIDAISTPGTLTLSMFESLGSGDTLQIGGVGSITKVMGDLTVDGDEIVNGDITLGDTSGDTLTVNATTTFNNDVTFGSSNADNVTFTSKVSSMVFKTSTGAKSISTDGTNNLTIETATSGNLILQSVGTSQLTSTTGTTVTAAANNNTTVSTTGTGLTTISSGSSGIDITGGGTVDITTNAAGAINIAPNSGSNVNITTAGAAGELHLTSAATTATAMHLETTAAGGTLALASGTGGITVGATGAAVAFSTTTSGDITFTPAGNLTLTKNSETVAFVSGSIDPTTGGGVVAPTGSIYLRDAAGGGTTGEVWVKQANATATSWTQLASATGSVSLQSAYNTGNTIETTASRPIVFESLYNGGVPSEFVVRHEGGGDNFLTTTTSSATAGSLDLGSTNVTVTSGNSLSFTGTTKTITTSTGNLTIATGAANGNILLDPDGTGYVQPVCNVVFDSTGNAARTISLAGSGTLTLNQSGTGAVAITATGGGVTTTASSGNVSLVASGNLSLTTDTGGNNITANVLTGSDDPRTTAKSAVAGSLYLRQTIAPNGSLYIKQDSGSTTNWLQVVANTTGAVSLQTAYSVGATITTASTTPVDFTLTSGGFNVTTSGSGNIQFDDGTNNFLLIDGTTKATTLSAIGATLQLNGGLTGNGAVDINATGTGAVTIDAGATGAVTVTGHASSTFTTDTGNATVSSTALTGQVIISALGATSGTVDINGGPGGVLIDGAGASHLTTSSGIITVDGAGGVSVASGSATTITIGEDSTGNTSLNLFSDWSTGIINIDCGAALTIGNDACGSFSLTTSAAGNIAMTAGAGGDISLDVSGAAGDILFGSHGTASPIPFNSATAGQTDLNSDLPQNIVGAINFIYTEAGGATVSVTTETTYSAGVALYLDPADGLAKLCDADVEASSVFLGFAKDASTATGGNPQTHTVYVSGEAIVLTNISGYSKGDVVFLSTTAGDVTDTAPTGTGDTVLKIGIVTLPGTGAGTGKVAIQVGTPVVL